MPYTLILIIFRIERKEKVLFWRIFQHRKRDNIKYNLYQNTYCYYMQPMFKYLLPFFLFLLIQSTVSKGQTNDLYSYQELSHLFFAKQKDSLKKEWICPSVYKEKSTQKKYKEIWDERTDFFTAAIANDHYVYDKEINNYIGEIIRQLVQANQQYIPVTPFIVLDRSPSVNAYAIGNNVVAINLGMIAFAQSREEIAFTLAHELSHNILQHAENAMKKKAEWLTSEEYKNSLNEILDSKYERLTRLKKVFENYSFDRSRHQRYHESDADSLAIILLKNSQLPFDPSFFLRLDSADMQYKQPLKQPIKDYFTTYNITVEEGWMQKRSKGLSTKNYSFQTTTTIQDSLKTHPDCIERYNKTLPALTAGLKTIPVPENIRKRATKMLIWNMYCNMHLAPSLYRILLEKDRGNNDAWYDFMLHNVMLGLLHSDKELRRFRAIGVTQKEYISKDYYELQTLLEQIPGQQLEQSCKTLETAPFWSGMAQQEKQLKVLMHVLAFDPENAGEIRTRAKEMITNSTTSPYCEFATAFEKK